MPYWHDYIRGAVHVETWSKGVVWPPTFFAPGGDELAFLG